MMYCLLWILFLILANTMVMPLPLESYKESRSNFDGAPNYIQELKSENSSVPENNNQIISVRITSSVAVARGNKYKYSTNEDQRNRMANIPFPPTNNLKTTGEMITDNNKSVFDSSSTQATVEIPTTPSLSSFFTNKKNTTDIDLTLEGANLEFIKQLRSRTTESTITDIDLGEPFEITSAAKSTNETDTDTHELPSTSLLEIEKFDNDYDEFSENIPLARSVSSQSYKNEYEDRTSKRQNKESNEKITTVSFKIVHDVPSIVPNYNSENNPKSVLNSDYQSYYDSLPKQYSQPAQVYSEPAQVYSEPAKFYSEPAKIYSEPAKVYSEPAKVYSEPAKYYSEPASLHLPPEASPIQSSWQQYSPDPSSSTNTIINTSTTPITPFTNQSTPIIPEKFEHPHKESNYEVDEKISVMTNGRTHGIQEPAPENCKQENCKVGYVVEGRQYRKYRVEERTSDGFIVGEYGVVRNVDGALRGVRYTADSEASPRLIYDALMKFLQL